MGELLEAYKAQKQYKDSVMDKIESKNKTLREAAENEASKFLSVKESRELALEKFGRFSNDVRDMLLAEAIYNIYSESLGILSENSKSVSEKLVTNWIAENGGSNAILNKMQGKTYVSETICNLVKKYHSIIIEKCNKEDAETMTVDPADKKDFLDELDKEDDIETMKNTIAIRVANAEEEFLNNNIADKADINSIVSDTSNRIEANKEDDSMDADGTDAVNQEATRISMRKINDLRFNRPRSVFEQMVRSLTEMVLKDESLREEYTSESGKLEMNKIVESARCMYGLLETVNTAKLEKVDSDYISNMLNIK